jgi:hypothetical protein
VVDYIKIDLKIILNLGKEDYMKIIEEKISVAELKEMS